MSKLHNKKLFLLDMDGTIYLGNQLFPYVHEFLAAVGERGGRYMFLTNNSSKSVSAYVEKLAQLGICATEEDFLTSTNATVLYLQKKNYKKIYALGTTSFREQLMAAGLPVTTEVCDDVDCLCMGFDTELTFSKLEDACILLGRDIDYIATNPDWVCPTEFGFVPDCGSVSQMLCHATGKMPQFIGKPQPTMVELAVEKAGFTKEETVLIGDRLYTDIASGENAGVSTIFVLSGEGTLDDLAKSETKPTFVMENIEEVYRDLLCE